ncbi:MAG: hypothetical protein H6774_02555 [Pseudomonadales bacterium]|nr:hypothetical protein [Pseudomonadales bacterium]
MNTSWFLTTLQLVALCLCLFFEASIGVPILTVWLLLSLVARVSTPFLFVLLVIVSLLLGAVYFVSPAIFFVVLFVVMCSFFVLQQHVFFARSLLAGVGGAGVGFFVAHPEMSVSWIYFVVLLILLVLFEFLVHRYE